jgi:hypothetical protein
VSFILERLRLPVLLLALASGFYYLLHRGMSGDNSKLFSLIVFVPLTHAANVRVALASSGAGSIGNYDSCSFSSKGVGRFRPLQGSNAFIGEVGKVEEVEEERIETEVLEEKLQAVLTAVKAAHPYEQPAIHVIGPLLNIDSLLKKK